MWDRGSGDYMLEYWNTGWWRGSKLPDKIWMERHTGKIYFRWKSMHLIGDWIRNGSVLEKFLKGTERLLFIARTEFVNKFILTLLFDYKV